MKIFDQTSYFLTSVSLALLLASCGGSDAEDEEPVDGDPVSLAVSVAGQGLISTESGSIRCGEDSGDCTEDYSLKTEETLVATPDIGHYFAGWQASECAGAASECTIFITSALDGASETTFQLNAVFRPVESTKQAASYTYDHLGRRLTKTVSGVTTIFIYDVQGNLISELTSDGKPVKEHIYLEGEEVVQATHRSGALPAFTYVYNDHLATPRMMTDQSGKIAWELESTPFGELFALYDENRLSSRFPGQYYDEETGLHYNRQRYYDPRIGRYMESDPLGLLAGPNTYAYVNGNPLGYSDPEGLCPWCVVGAVIGGGLNAYSQYQNNGGFDNFNWGSFVASTASGALGGGLGTVTARIGTNAGWLIASNSAGSAAISAGVTAAQNQLTGKCNSVADSALTGAIFGAVGAGIGSGVYSGIGAINMRTYRSLPLSVRTLYGSNAIHGVSRPTLIPAGSAISNAASNIATNLSSYQPSDS